MSINTREKERRAGSGSIRKKPVCFDWINSVMRQYFYSTFYYFEMTSIRNPLQGCPHYFGMGATLEMTSSERFTSIYIYICTERER